MAKRLDQALVERGYFETRARAQAAIEAGLVTVDGTPARKASQGVTDNAVLTAEAPHPYVSRGGVKLAAALDHFGIDPAGMRALDIGASTGGFTDCLLQRGAAHVLAVDVGTGQLHHSLKGHPRLTSMEGMDIRNLPAEVAQGIGLIVADVSFISLSAILPEAWRLSADGAVLIALIKPQFEAERSALKKGILRDEARRQEIVQRLVAQAEAIGWRLLGIIPSPIMGGDGNQEYLLVARR